VSIVWHAARATKSLGESQLKKEITRGRFFALSSVALGALAAVAGGSPAHAQEEGEDEAIVVTGSRIVRQDYVANSPIVTVDREDLEITGVQTVDTLLNQLPQFAPGVSASSNNPSNGGQSNVQLRGLGANRTLVMVDGRRLVPSNPSGTVDVNIIPAQLVGNIEIVTGGASATYGSDAIGGVINFQLRDFEGFEINTQYGETFEGDGANSTVSLALGGEFDGGRGRAMAMMSWDERGVIYNAARPWAAISGASTTSPLGSTIFDGTNLPTQAAVTAAVPGALRTETFGFNNDGTLFSYTNRNQFVSPGGITFDGGIQPGAVIFSPNFQYITGPLNYLVLPLVRYNAFTRAEYEINPFVEAYADILYTYYDSANELAATPTSPGTNNRVPFNNPFIPTELATVLASRPDANDSFRIDKRFNALGGRHQREIYNVAQLTGGFRGDFEMAPDWTYDVYASYGRMQRDSIQTGNVSRGAIQTLLNDPNGGAGDELFTPGLDADNDPDGLICAGGFDWYGETTLSPQCQAFIGRTSKNLTEYEIRIGEATVQGELPIGLPFGAGNLQVALGAAYREDYFNFIPDGSLTAAMVVQPTNCSTVVPAPLAASGPCLSGNDIAGFNPSNPLSGEITVFEMFGEVLIPIVRDLPLMQEVNIIIGGRASNYSTVETIETHKVDLEWTLVDGFRFRGSYENAIRAPSVQELFAIPTLGFPAIGNPTAGGAPAFGGDPCDVRSAWRSTAGSNLAAPTNAQVRQLCLDQGMPLAVVDTFTYGQNQIPAIQGGGNPNLNAEVADTWSVGFVIQPRWDGFGGWFEDFSASIDYYDIRVDDFITFLTPALPRSSCFNTPAGQNTGYSNANVFCQMFTRDAASGQITNFQSNFINTGGLQVRGIDLALDWSHDVGAGTLSVDFIGNFQAENSGQALPGLNWVEGAGSVGLTIGSATPEYRYTTTVGYELGPMNLAVRHQWIDDFQTPAGTIWPVMQYWDALVNWDVNQTVTLRAGINNITDEEPNTFNGAQQANTDPSLYDVYGRRFFVGLRASF
jgi:iron complex outermembrane recepter protein